MKKSTENYHCMLTFFFTFIIDGCASPIFQGCMTKGFWQSASRNSKCKQRTETGNYQHIASLTKEL